MRGAPSAGCRIARTSPFAVAAELEAAGVRPRKSRGQNFLVQPAIADRIVAAAAIAPGDEVVEIGPGLGILSDKILRAGVRRLWLVELDPRLAERLESAFAGHPAVRVVCRDFLEVELAELVERPPVKVIGNLPFNAAAAILRRLDEMRGAIGRMVLMFQREVAERIRARAGERAYSALSVFTALYWETREHFRVCCRQFPSRAARRRRSYRLHAARAARRLHPPTRPRCSARFAPRFRPRARPSATRSPARSTPRPKPSPPRLPAPPSIRSRAARHALGRRLRAPGAARSNARARSRRAPTAAVRRDA